MSAQPASRRSAPRSRPAPTSRKLKVVPKAPPSERAPSKKKLASELLMTALNNAAQLWWDKSASEGALEGLLSGESVLMDPLATRDSKARCAIPLALFGLAELGRDWDSDLGAQLVEAATAFAQAVHRTEAPPADHGPSNAEIAASVAHRGGLPEAAITSVLEDVHELKLDDDGRKPVRERAHAQQLHSLGLTVSLPITSPAALSKLTPAELYARVYTTRDGDTVVSMLLGIAEELDLIGMALESDAPPTNQIVDSFLHAAGARARVAAELHRRMVQYIPNAELLK